MTAQKLHHARIRALASTFLSLQALLDEVESDTFRPGRSPAPREDTTERSIGLVSDPTPSIAADVRRQRLREAWVAADAVLLSACNGLDEVARELINAHDRWLGVVAPDNRARTDDIGDHQGPQNLVT